MPELVASEPAVQLNVRLVSEPKKMTAKITTAAIIEIMIPYSTAEAPRSLAMFSRAASQVDKYLMCPIVPPVI